MRFPNYKGYPAPQRPLLDSYIALVASSGMHERGSRDPVRRTAHAIGRACLRITQDRHREAAQMLELIRLSTAPFAHSARDAAGRQQRLHHHIAGMILAREKPGQLNKARRAMHGSIINDLHALVGEFQRSSPKMTYNERRLHAGLIIDKTVTGLYTRWAHPWLFAGPSLMHQDRTFSTRKYKHTGNFDTTLIHTGPYQPRNWIRRIQTKLGCIGVCEEGRPTAARTKYTPDITLVSGCCDLGASIWRHQLDSPVTTLLFKEAQEYATPEEVLQLDAIGNGLLLDATRRNNGRQGTWTPPIDPVLV